jgi:hypothetical protein
MGPPTLTHLARFFHLNKILKKKPLQKKRCSRSYSQFCHWNLIHIGRRKRGPHPPKKNQKKTKDLKIKEYVVVT